MARSPSLTRRIVTFREGHGPSQVEFSADGKTLVATSGFQDENTSRIHAYKVMEDGMPKEGPGSPAEPKGASGTIGFSLDPSGNRAYMSAFRGSAVIAFALDTKTAGLNQLGQPLSDKQMAACWTAIAPDGRTLYVANFVSNSIAPSKFPPTASSRFLAPPGDVPATARTQRTWRSPGTAGSSTPSAPANARSLSSASVTTACSPNCPRANHPSG